MPTLNYISDSRIAVLVILILSSRHITAQEQDSLQIDTSSFYSSFEEEMLLADSLEASQPISYQFIQRYQPYYHSFPYFRTGNPGHAMYSPDLRYLTRPSDIRSTALQPVMDYFESRESIRYFRSRPPFTSLTYYSGPKKEEGIDVLHTRNFGKNLNMGLHFNKNASNGFYNHMRTVSTYFNLNLNYSTTNQRYTLLSHYYYNRKQVQENGGFVNFGQIENPETFGSSMLSNASNDFTEEGFLLSQTFGFGNRAMEGKTVIKPVLRLGHDFQFFTGRRRYEDFGSEGKLNTNFYPAIYHDSAQTLDTNFYSLLSNQFNIFLYPSVQVAKLYYRNESITYRQGPHSDSLYDNHFAGFSWNYPGKSHSDIFLRGEYAIAGFREGDLKAEVGARKNTIDSIKGTSTSISLSYNLNNPQIKELYYISNNFIWSNDFRKTSSIALLMQTAWKGYTLRLDLGEVSNFIYYDSLFNAAQFETGIRHFTAGLNKLLNFRAFHLDNKLMYQWTSEPGVLPVPEMMINESIYLQGQLFKQIVTFQAGFDIFYFTGFKGMAYMPALGEFHVQNTVEVGNYPFIDFFFTFRLKRAIIFVKMEHVNKGMTGDNFYLVPNYPVPPRSFKWGLRWVLYD